MTRYIILLLSVFFLSSCEDANVLVMTDAAKDAITAITLSDEAVRDLAQRAAQTSDSKHHVAPSGNPYDIRLRRVLADFSERNRDTSHSHGHNGNHEGHHTQHNEPCKTK